MSRAEVDRMREAAIAEIGKLCEARFLKQGFAFDTGIIEQRIDQEPGSLEIGERNETDSAEIRVCFEVNIFEVRRSPEACTLETHTGFAAAPSEQTPGMKSGLRNIGFGRQFRFANMRIMLEVGAVE